MPQDKTVQYKTMQRSDPQAGGWAATCSGARVCHTHVRLRGEFHGDVRGGVGTQSPREGQERDAAQGPLLTQ